LSRRFGSNFGTPTAIQEPSPAAAALHLRGPHVLYRGIAFFPFPLAFRPNLVYIKANILCDVQKKLEIFVHKTNKSNLRFINKNNS
jgi:hypothetical protein